MVRRRIFDIVTAILIFLCLTPALGLASNMVRPLPGQIAEGSPDLSIVIRDTGETSDLPLREWVLEAVVTAQDSTLLQTLRYYASLSPEQDSFAGHGHLVDLNFDGNLDLCLTTAAGARNVFHAFALWNPDAGRFDSVMQSTPWLPEESRFAQEPSQLEFCCYELLPETGRIVSNVADGYRYSTQTAYGWEGDRGIAEDGVARIYDAGEDMIGEKLELFATGILRCWDMQYPEIWYHGQEGVLEERLASIHAVTQGDATTDPTWMRVSNVDWVHLRKQDSKDSPSLAKLNAGSEVIVLRKNCGTDSGWVRVWVDPEACPGIIVEGFNEDGAWLTGYIWHSFLEAVD